MRKVLILSQFETPFDLTSNPKNFDSLCEEALQEFDRRDAECRKRYGWGIGGRPEVKEVVEDFHPWMGTSVLAAGEDGNAFIWKRCWDSSG